MNKLNRESLASKVQRREVGAEDHVTDRHTNNVTAERGRRGIIDAHSPEDDDFDDELKVSAETFC